MFNSIRVRVGFASLVAIAIALFVASSVIGNLFKDYATRQFESTLQSHFLEVVRLAERDPKTDGLLFKPSASEPRWSTPLSGLYWQADLRNGQTIRSRSLWDKTLNVNPAEKTEGAHFYLLTTSQGQDLLALSKHIVLDGVTPIPFLLTVAADKTDLMQSISQFQSQMQWYLIILAIALLGMVLLQITVGLSPLSSLKQSVQRLRNGDAERIEGRFPQEFSPLINELNATLEQNNQLIKKARAQAGNLAHAIKTPLAAISNALLEKKLNDADFRLLVHEQTALAKQQVDWNLARSKTFARSRHGVYKTPVLDGVKAIVRVMEKVYADKFLLIDIKTLMPRALFNGEEHDFHEILGNLIDNACKWAKKNILISINCHGKWLFISIEDDGPGIAANHVAHVIQRGFRLDELTPGSGLGLAIVDDLVSAYSGNIVLTQSSLGGLNVMVKLPRSN